MEDGDEEGGVRDEFEAVSRVDEGGMGQDGMGDLQKSKILTTRVEMRWF